MKKSFYQKTWFKNLILIGIPAIISVIGVLIGLLSSDNLNVVEIVFSCCAFCAFCVLIAFMIYYSKQDDIVEKNINELTEDNRKMKILLEHFKTQDKANMHTINTLSSFAELWSKNINAFADEVQKSGMVSGKNWDKASLYNLVCEKCRDTIEMYVGDTDHTKISVGFIEYLKKSNQEEWVRFCAHSNPESTRPRVFDKLEKLSECKYRYAQLMRNKNSDIEVAINNEEILQLFNRSSPETDLRKYTQYIAIPVFCSKKKMLGVFQIITKYNYIIINDKAGLRHFAESNLIPFSNLIVLIDKISKGLYARPQKSDESDGEQNG